MKQVDDEFSEIMSLPIVACFCIDELEHNWPHCQQQLMALVKSGHAVTVNIRGDLSYKLQNRILASVNQLAIRFTIYGRHFTDQTSQCIGLIVT
ncbi:hypothetical protein [Lactiplantibacillus fabifermentans]|uniref:Uncharacterized protein n=2 Tax=Lactiplantibacillus fabifermentans TaxID=483011 RepID=A0A0R2NGL2_9LACO|nr:hypothetical protein [Lactiplantibacillus fabifermentans]ETY72675.1 hypothetical protein LFAB_16570 [Lactiplantibacillus fabifermentans T30PCM01]KRO23085.1 hypothetical protein DY78_GL001854 [Lactiplantibacillus fabifermentans DSM 21115]